VKPQGEPLTFPRVDLWALTDLVMRRACGGSLPTLALTSEGWLFQWWVLQAPFVGLLGWADTTLGWQASVQAVFHCEVLDPEKHLGGGVAFCSASEPEIDYDRGRRLSLNRALHQGCSPFTRKLRQEAWARFEVHFGPCKGWGT